VRLGARCTWTLVSIVIGLVYKPAVAVRTS